MTTEKETHWIDDDQSRKGLFAFSKNAPPNGLGLEEEEIYDALKVPSLHDFKGDKAMAFAMLKAYAADIDDHRLIRSLKPQELPPTAREHSVAFLDVFAPDGTRIAITAREGASPDTVALTALALWDGAQILARLGWQTAAENGKAAVATLVPEPVEDWQSTSPLPPPAGTAPPAPTAQAPSGNGGGELLTEFVKITAPKGKAVIEFWRPNRQYAEIKWHLGGEAFLKASPALAETGWLPAHLDEIGAEHKLPLKITWVPSPKNEKWKDIVTAEPR